MILDFRIWNQTSAASENQSNLGHMTGRRKGHAKNLKEQLNIIAQKLNHPSVILGPRSEFPDWIHHFQTFFVKYFMP